MKFDGGTMEKGNFIYQFTFFRSSTVSLWLWRSTLAVYDPLVIASATFLACSDHDHKKQR